MLNTVANFNDLANNQYAFLKKLLTGVSVEELDWEIHPESNSIRWVIGHLGWFEDYLSDAIENTGRYHIDKGPQFYPFDDLDQFLVKFDKARDRRVALYEGLLEADLERKISFVGVFDVPIQSLIRTHAGHLAGHVYQVRFIRGTYSRANETDKSIFDPW